MRAKTAFCWARLRSTLTACYLSRRIGRSQNGRAGGSSWPLPLAGLPPRSAAWAGGAAGGGAGGFGFGPADERWWAVAAGHPLDGQAGPWGREPPPLIGGADPGLPNRAGARDGAEDPVAAARLRPPAGPCPPAATERPAPRDQPEAAPAAPADPLATLDPLDPLDPFDPFDPFDRGGRSSGGATRPAPPSASGRFLLRAEPAPPTPL